MLGGNKGEAMARQLEEWGECILPFQTSPLAPRRADFTMLTKTLRLLLDLQDL